jgi:hypothetical protein
MSRGQIARRLVHRNHRNPLPCLDKAILNAQGRQAIKDKDLMHQ